MGTVRLTVTVEGEGGGARGTNVDRLTVAVEREGGGPRGRNGDR